jgi:hypothetical protein
MKKSGIEITKIGQFVIPGLITKFNLSLESKGGLETPGSDVIIRADIWMSGEHLSHSKSKHQNVYYGHCLVDLEGKKLWWSEKSQEISAVNIEQFWDFAKQILSDEKQKGFVKVR